MKRFSILIFLLVVQLNSLFSSEFFITRLKYEGGGDWYSNPTSINNLLEFISKNTDIKCSKFEKVTEIINGNIFNHPYLYLTGHGNIDFKDNEIPILRKHLLNGGFLHADDNYGLDKSFRAAIKKIFPDKELITVPFDHPIYSSIYKFPNGLPKIHKHDGKPPEGLGIFHEGRLILFYSYESDLGDGWEDFEVHQDSEIKRKRALRMGTNLVYYYLSN